MKALLASVLPSRTLIALLGVVGVALIGLRFSSLAPATIALVAASLGVALLALLAI